MKNTELKKLKKEIREYRKEAFFEAFFPIGKFTPKIAPIKVMFDIICTGCIISLPFVPNFLLPLAIILSLGSLSIGFFSFVLYDNLTNPEYEKLKEDYKRLKNEDNLDSTEVKCVTNNKPIIEKEQNNTKEDSQIKISGQINDESVKQIDSKIDELEDEQPFVKVHKRR